MKNRSWKLVGAIALVGSLVALLAFTVHLMRSTGAANRELDALRAEVGRQQAEVARQQSQLLAPIAAQVSDLSESLKSQAGVLADLDELGARIAKIEAEALAAEEPAEERELQPTAQAPSQPEGRQPTETAAEPAASAGAAPAAETPPAPQAVTAGDGSESGAADQVDEGRFVILQTGIPVGVEEFTLRRSGNGYTMTSTLRGSGGTRGTELLQTLDVSATWQPIEYALTGTTDGAAQDIRATFSAGQLFLTTAGTQRINEALQTGPAIVNFGWAAPSSFAIFHRALGAGMGQSSLGALALRADRPDLVQMVVGAANPITVTDGSTKSLGSGHEVRVAEDTRTAWYYVHNDIVIAVAVPYEDLFAYREDLFPKGLLLTPRTLVEMAAPLGVVEFPSQVVDRGATLKGTFTIPYTATEKMPGVLLIPDLGPYDRNGDAVGLETKILRDLALRLGQQGVASYRLDVRGIGESGGDYSMLTLDDLETDALVALIALRSNPRIDAANMFVVGVGYGGLVAQRLGAKGFAAGAVCLAMPARSLRDNAVEIVRRRAEAEGRSAQDAQTLVEREQAYWRFVQTTQGAWADVGWKSAQSVLPWLSELDYVARSRLAPLPLLRDVLDKNPLDAVRALQKRTLFVQGNKDFAVPTADADLLVQAARDAGNQEASAEVLDGLNHWLRAQPESASSRNGHLNEEMSWSAIAAILDWIAPQPPLPEGGKSGPSPAS